MSLHISTLFTSIIRKLFAFAGVAVIGVMQTQCAFAAQFNEALDIYFTNVEEPADPAASNGLQFGGTLEKYLYYDKSNTIFVFTDSLSIEGDLHVSGVQTFAASPDPSIPATDTFSVYSKAVSGRMLLKGKGPSGLDYPYQPSFFQNQICMLSAGATTTINAVGCAATNDTTLSTPAVTETYGFMTNFATSTTLNDTAGSSQNVVSVFRGSQNGANGFFFNARVAVVDTTLVRLFTGLGNQTTAVMVQNDNPAGHHVGFQYSTARGDTTWQIESKDGTTQTIVDTGIPVTAAKVYDMYLFCTPQCASISWRIDNVTDGTTAEGTKSTNLPGGSTAMRMITGVSTLTTAAKNYRMQRLYVESDR